MRVLALLPPPSWGGLHAHLGATARAFASAGMGEIVPCLPLGAGFDAIAHRFINLGLAVERVEMGRIRFNRVVANLYYLARLNSEAIAIARLAHDGGYDVIQTPGAHHFHGILAARKAGLPLVWQLHSDFAPALLRRLAVALIQRYAQAVMINGHAVASRFPGIEQGSLTPVYFGPVVEPDAFLIPPSTRYKIRAEFGISPETVIIGTVGVRSRQKAHERLVAAVDAVPNTTLILVGKLETSTQRYYEKTVLNSNAARRLRSDNRLLVIDPDRPIAEYLAAFDIFAMSSQAEGMPLALAEAMEAGLPSACIGVGGIIEMIENGKTGFVVPAGDIPGLAATLRHLTEDPVLRQRMSEAARDYAAKNFRANRTACAHYKAYCLALGLSEKLCVVSS